MRIVAFDPGIGKGTEGGVAWLVDGVTQAMVLPILEKPIVPDRCLNENAVYELLSKINPQLVIIERQWGRTGDRQIFGLAHCYGAIKGICTGLHIPYELIAPTTWQSKLLKEIKKDNTVFGVAPSSKDLSIEFCQKYYPQVSLLKTPRCKKPHTGIADALCLLDYGLRFTANTTKKMNNAA